MFWRSLHWGTIYLPRIYSKRMPKSQPDTPELIDSLDKIEEEISSNINSEVKNEEVIERQATRLQELANGLERRMENVETLRESEEVEKLVRQISDDTRRIVSQIEEVNETRKDLESMLSRIRNIREALASVVEEELDTKIIAEFQNRREELSKSLRWWKFWTGLSVLALILSSSYIYIDINPGATSTSVAFSKILLLLPVLVSVWFSFHQYNTHKRLIEQYEFKTSMADSLMGFREILRQDFSEDQQERVGEFVIASVNKIYSNPDTDLSASGSERELPKSNFDIIRQLKDT